MATLGNASGTSQESGLPAGYLYTSGSGVGAGYTATENGTITKLTLKTQGPVANSCDVRMVVYAETAGLPATLVCYGEQKTFQSTDPAAEYDWTTLTGSTSIVSGTKYWIGIYQVSNVTNGLRSFHNIVSSGIAKYKTGQSDPPPDPFPASPLSDNEQWWAYLTYTPAGASYDITPASETDSAEFVTVASDRTIGNATGSSPSFLPSAYLYVSGSAVGSGYLASTNGVVSKITVKLQGPSDGTVNVRAVVYEESAGLPATLVCYSATRSFTPTDPAAEYDFTGFTGPRVITSGRRYWIGLYPVNQTNTHLQTFYTLGASGISKYQTFIADPPPGTFPPTPLSDTEQLWAYLTYTGTTGSFALGPASETDEVEALSVGPASVPRIAAAGLVYLFGDAGVSTLSLTPVSETDSAVALDIGSPLGWGGPWGGPWGAVQLTLTPVTETDSAEPLEILARHAITSVGETDTAVALSITHTIPAVPIPDSLALPLGYREAPDLYGRVTVCDLPSSYWRLDVSHYLEDTVGNATLAPVGAPTLTAGLIGYGTARSLGGSDAFTTTASPANTLGDTFTLECWFTPAGVTGTQTLFSKGPGAFNLRLDDASLVLAREDDFDILWSDGSVFTAGQTYHIVATKDGGNVHLYVNAEDVSFTVDDHTCENTLVALNIGRKSDGTEFSTGVLDEVAIYPYPLTADMVAMHFLAGSGEFGVKHFDSDEYPAMSVEIAFDSPWNDPYPRWENVTEDLRVAGLTINASGRADETQRSSPSAAQVLLDNRGRDFDPTNTVGEYGDRILPMRQTRIRFAWETMYWGFKGWADDWTVNEISMGYDSTTTINCVDMFQAFANYEFDSENTLFPEQLAGERIAACCDLLGIPDNQRNIDAGLSVMPLLDRPTGKILDHILAVADSDGGFLHVGLDGRLVYEGRRTRVAMPVFATFGDADPELPYSGIDRSSNTAYMFNRAIVTPGDGNDDAVAEDAASLLEHPPLTYTKTVLTGFNEAQAAAEWYVARYKDPAVRFLSVDLNGASDPDLLWATVLGTVNSLRYRFRRRPLGGGTMELDEYVERIAHKISASGWVITWSLSPFGDEDLWPLDDPAFLLGDNTYPTW